MSKILVAALLLFTQSAQAGNFVLGVGVSQFTKAPNGNWYQADYPHALDLRSGSATVRYDFDNDVSLGYVYTGKSSVHSLVKVDEIAWVNNTPYPLSNLYGEGKSEGVFLSARTEGSLYLTYGGMLYRSTWDVTIPDYTMPDRQPFSTSIHHRPTWELMPMGGIGYRWKQNSIELNLLPVACKGDSYPAIYRGYAVNFSILHKF